MNSSVSAAGISMPVTALVTGSTGGIGHEVARLLLAEGATVIVHGPTREEVAAARESLLATGVPGERIEAEVADFRDLPSVIALASRVAARHPRLEVLVNNAAVGGGESRAVTGDGHELIFQVNYLAPYLLTRMLWAPLCAAEAGRVVNVSSLLHRSANFDWSDLEGTRRYSRTSAYAKSKQLLTMFSRGAASVAADAGERLESVSVHPGVVDSGLLPLYARAGSPVERAASAVVRLCDPKNPVRSGAFYDGGIEAPAAPLVDNEKAVARLWKATAKAVGFDVISAPAPTPLVAAR
jgi:NAD(P)-dependent dehydrogenase (short-subunit alcohol dehydrogenase family)